MSLSSGKTAFFELLDCYVHGPHVPWEQAMRDIMSDSRYGALRTMDEKKQAYAEWCERGRKAEAASVRAARKLLRADFAQLVSEKLSNSTPAVSYGEVRPLLTRDPRFAALDDENERAEVFAECLRRRDRERQAAARVVRQEEIARLKAKFEGDTRLTPQTPWKKVRDEYLSAFDFKQLTQLDVVGFFEAYTRGLARKEQLEQRLHKDEAERQCRAARDAFRDLLQEHVARGLITLDTKWKTFKPAVEEEPRYKALKKMMKKSGCSSYSSGNATPAELFDEAVGILRDRYNADKELMQQALEGRTLEDGGVTAEKVKAALVGVDVPEQSLERFSAEVVRHAAEREAKRQRKLERAFTDELERKRAELAPGMAFEEAEGRGLTGFYGLDEKARRRVFEEYISRLGESSDGSSPSSSSSSRSSSSPPPRKKLDDGKTRHSHHHHHGHSRHRSHSHRHHHHK